MAEFALQQEIQVHNQKTQQLNRDIQKLNQNNKQLVASAHQFNQTFQPRLFHKGHFNGKQIFIYEFSSVDELRLTLAHEFGHALGLNIPTIQSPSCIHVSRNRMPRTFS